jgi:4'-phosphopantetheinyl transferase
MTLWPMAAHEVAPVAGHVDVWRCDLRCGPNTLGRLWDLLDDGERRAARAFRFEWLLRRYVASHGMLRLLLGQALEVAPASVTFTKGLHGKPRVAAETPLEFNLAHAGEMALIAICTDGAVGVDLEALDRPGMRYEEIAAVAFTAPENAFIEASRDATAWWRHWTRKEAYVKATGEGLSRSPDSFSLSQVLPARTWQPASDRHWQIRDLDPEPGYVGAVATRGPRRLRQWSFADAG